jgi:hypothetical protein
MLDLSQPMQQDWETLKTTLINSYTALEQSDESALLAFNLSADGSSIAPPGQLDQEHEMNFTNDEGALINLIGDLTIPENATAPLHQALSKALHLTATAASHQPRAILLITNGRDTANNETLALREAQEAQLPIYVIAAGEQPDTSFLQQLAGFTGGRYYPPEKPVHEALTEIISQLKQTYRLEYTSPTPPDNALHTLSIATRTTAGNSNVSLEFRAYYPLDPLIAEISATSPDWPAPIILGSLASARGLITLQPKVLARGPIHSLNYIESARIAPRHVQIIYNNHHYIIRKLTTAHMARLNGRDFLRQPLADGDRLEMGDHILIFRQIT